MKSIILALVIGVSGPLCAMQGQGTKRSTSKKTVKKQNNRCNRGGRTEKQRRKEDAAIKSFLAAKCSRQRCQGQGQERAAGQPNPAPVLQPSRAQHQGRSQGHVTGRPNPVPVSQPHQGRGQEGTVGRPNRDQISRDEAYARELQNELNRKAEPNPVPVLQPSRAQHQGRSQGQVTGRPNPAPVSQPHQGRGQEGTVGRPNRDQISRDEAFALELQNELNREALGEPNLDQISQDEAYALELQNELYQGQGLGEPNPDPVYGPQPQSDDYVSDDDSLDELNPARLSQPRRSEASAGQPSEPAVIECPICMDRQTNMNAPCCLQKVCRSCWDNSVGSNWNRTCPFCRRSQLQ